MVLKTPRFSVKLSLARYHQQTTPRDHRTKVGVLGVDGAAEVRGLAHASGVTPELNVPVARTR